MKHHESVQAILRGGGNQASVVYDGIKDLYAKVFVWSDSSVESLHPSLKGLPRFDKQLKAGSQHMLKRYTVLLL